VISRRPVQYVQLSSVVCVNATLVFEERKACMLISLSEAVDVNVHYSPNVTNNQRDATSVVTFPTTKRHCFNR